MGATRIQQKSRPTKRPMVTAAGAVKARRPKLDKKGYPATAGEPIPVLVLGAAVPAEPTPPDGFTVLGYWNVISAGPPSAGEVVFIYPSFTLDVVDAEGTDHTTALDALIATNDFYIESLTGSNTMNIAVNNTGGDFDLDAEAPVGVLFDGQVLWVFTST